ncbi:MAG: TetR/AcrR family transcriptional regulator [Solirubrobacteraceae bacterium]|nr:TetR/AcrR family transcriptional regulator [Solirubrobacteraceae bacterium]
MSLRAQRVPAAEAKRRITEAASRLLAGRPFRELTVEEVMAEAGLPRTVFYRHFTGLPDVVLGLVEALRLSLAEGGDPEAPDFLRTVLSRVVDIAHRNGGLLRAVYDAAAVDADVERALDEATRWSVDATAALFEAGMAAGRTPPLDAHAVSHALTQMNFATLVDAFGRHAETADPERVLEALMTVWERVIVVQPGMSPG